MNGNGKNFGNNVNHCNNENIDYDDCSYNNINMMMITTIITKRTMISFKDNSDNVKVNSQDKDKGNTNKKNANYRIYAKNDEHEIYCNCNHDNTANNNNIDIEKKISLLMKNDININKGVT